MQAKVALLLPALIAAISAQSTPEAPNYVAGVVEYAKILSSDPIQETNLNLDAYLRLLRAPEARTADIIVFPESALNNVETAVYLPEPDELVEPCVNRSYSELVSRLSCEARATGTYVVVNFLEKADCPDRQQIRLNDHRPCNENGTNIYNTNVVFNRNGIVVAKYRKFNLFGEKGTMAPVYPESEPFSTDFGVVFGQFICFDLMFDKPALTLVNRGVKNFIFSNHWYSELPFLSAVQIQQSWALKNNVNLLSAGYSNPSEGSTGTGVYHGRFGPLVRVMSPVPQTRLYLATVPKNLEHAVLPPEIVIPPQQISTPSEMLNLFLKRETLEVYISKGITFGTNVTETLCYGHFCCDFHLNVTTQPIPLDQPGSYRYRMAIFDGIRSFDGYANGAVKVCAIIACTNKDRRSCGLRFDNQTAVFDSIIFNDIDITANFKKADNLLILPTSVDTSILPFPVQDFMYFEELVTNSSLKTTISLLSPKSNLLTFGIWARDFNFKPSGAPSIGLSIILIFLASLNILKYF